MGVSRTPAEFGMKIEAIGEAVNPREIVDQAAELTKSIILSVAASKGVRPGSRLATIRWQGVKVVPGGTTDNPISLVKITGPFWLIDNKTKPHVIRPRRRGGKRAISYDGHATALVHHPGTKGKGIFAAAKAQAERVVPEQMAGVVVSSWQKANR